MFFYQQREDFKRKCICHRNYYVRTVFAILSVSIIKFKFGTLNLFIDNVYCKSDKRENIT